jgi:hypothetical protein
LSHCPETGFEEPWAGSAFDASKLPRMRLLARVKGTRKFTKEVAA